MNWFLIVLLVLVVLLFFYEGFLLVRAFIKRKKDKTNSEHKNKIDERRRDEH